MTASAPGSDLGRHVFGAAAVASGLIMLVWHDYHDVAQLRSILNATDGPAFVYAAAAAQIPPGQMFWAVATTVAFALAAAALLTNRTALLATRLLTVMIVAFGLLVWVPLCLSTPHSHTNWSENALTFAIAGAVWILADILGERDMPSRRAQSGRPA